MPYVSGLFALGKLHQVFHSQKRSLFKNKFYDNQNDMIKQGTKLCTTIFKFEYENSLSTSREIEI